MGRERARAPFAPTQDPPIPSPLATGSRPRPPPPPSHLYLRAAGHGDIWRIDRRLRPDVLSVRRGAAGRLPQLARRLPLRGRRVGGFCGQL
eukprot:scaffold187676_cov26-Tisochrysis_lutea.AAC.9